MKVDFVKKQFEEKNNFLKTYLKIIEYNKFNEKFSSIFLFLDSENPFLIYKLHTDKKLNNLYRNLFIQNKFFKLYLPCVSNFDNSIECPICKSSFSESWDLYYLKGIEYIVKENNKFFKDFIILIFKKYSEILDFVSKLERIGQEINYVIISKNKENPEFFNITLPKEQTIEKAKQLIEQFDITLFFKKFVNHKILDNFDSESILKYKYKLERVLSKLITLNKNLIEEVNI